MNATVAFVLPSFEIGGSQRVCLTLLNHLDQRMFTPELVVFEASGALADMVDKSIPVHDLGRPRLRRVIGPLIRELRNLRPQIIFSTLGYTNLALLASLPLLRFRPRVVIRESNTPSKSMDSLAHAWALRLGYRWLYPRADAVICQSRVIGSELIENFGLRPSQLHYLCNPVDIDRIRHLASPPQRVPGSGLRLLAAGHLIRQKGFDRLLEIFAKLPVDAHLTVLGDGVERSRLEEQARRLGIAERIAMPGFAERPWPLFAGADAFLLPSRWEGLPNVALEALACGTQVIGTPDAGGLDEVAAAASGGVTLASSAEAFIAAILRSPQRPAVALSHSLLPVAYELNQVVPAFSQLLRPSP